MTQTIRLALTILVFLLAVAVLSHFLAWMNLASDARFWGGVAGVLLLVIAVPSILAAIWRAERSRPR